MCEACTTAARRGALRDVVAVEADVDVAERHLVVEQLARAARAGARRARRRGGGCRRSASPSGPRVRSTISCAIRTSVRRMSSPSRTTLLLCSTCSFLASRDRVKGTDGRCLVAAAPVASARAMLQLDSRGGSPALREAASRSRRSRAARSCRSKTARASSRISRAGVAARDVREREHPHLGLARELGRPGAAVLWPVSRARSASSLENVASCTSRSAPCAATRSHVARRGVAGDHDLAPRAGPGPSPAPGVTPPTVSPRCSRPKSGPGSTPSARGELGVEAARAARPRRARSRTPSPRWRDR